MAQRGLGYNEAPSEMFANNASVVENGQGVSFTATIFIGEDEMSDFNGAKPVQTVRDNEFKIQLVDGASGAEATKKLSILQKGEALSAGVNDFGVLVFGEDESGNGVALPVGAAGVKVEASDLDIRDLSHSQDSVKIGDGTDFLEISGDGEASVEVTKAQGAPGAAAPVEAIQIAGSDGTNLRALKTDSAGRLEIVSQDISGSDVCEHKTTATVGTGAVTTHDYVVTDTKLFVGYKVLVGARGAVKVRVGTFDGTTFTPKFVYFQDPKENKDISIGRLNLLGDGTKAVRIEITNQDGASSDVYSTLQGDEK